MGKSSSAQDSITPSKAGGPLPPSTKLPCAEIARAQVKTFDATARARAPMLATASRAYGLS